MKSLAKFSISVKGDESGKLYEGDFEVKTILTLRERAIADEVRRNILGSSPEMASTQVATFAFSAGQLYVRITEAPQWFQSAGQGGIELPDFNVIEEIFLKALQKEDERKRSILENADTAKKKIKKKLEKKSEESEDEE